MDSDRDSEGLYSHFLSIIIREAHLNFPIAESDFSPKFRNDLHQEINKIITMVNEHEYRVKEISKPFDDEKSRFKPAGTKLFKDFLVTLLVVSVMILSSFGISIYRPAVGGIWWLALSFVLLLLSLAVIVVWGFGRDKEKQKERQRFEAELERRRLKALQDADSFLADYHAKISDLASMVRTEILAGTSHVNFERLLGILKERGIVLEKIECPSCGGIVKMSEVPRKQEVLVCKYCGKSILATNIFEKFKELLGQ